MKRVTTFNAIDTFTCSCKSFRTFFAGFFVEIILMKRKKIRLATRRTYNVKSDFDIARYDDRYKALCVKVFYCLFVTFEVGFF